MKPGTCIHGVTGARMLRGELVSLDCKHCSMSLRPRPGETPAQTVERVVVAARS